MQPAKFFFNEYRKEHRNNTKMKVLSSRITASRTHHNQLNNSRICCSLDRIDVHSHPRWRVQVYHDRHDRELELHQEKVEHAQHLRLGRAFRHGGNERSKVAIQEPPAVYVRRRDYLHI